MEGQLIDGYLIFAAKRESYHNFLGLKLLQIGSISRALKP